MRAANRLEVLVAAAAACALLTPAACTKRESPYHFELPTDTPPDNTALAHDELPASFPRVLDQDAWLTVSAGEVTTRFRPIGIAGSGMTPRLLSRSTAIFDGDTVLYPNVLAGIDLSYQVGNLSVHQLYLLGVRPSLDSGDELAFIERIASGTVPIEARVGGVTVGREVMRTEGAIDIVRADDGALLMRIPRPEAWDSNPHGRMAIPLAHEIVEEDSGELTYSVLVPEGYLADARRTYPVTVDPTWEIPCSGVNGPEWCNDGDPCTVDDCKDLGNGQSGCQHLVPDDMVNQSCWNVWFCHRGSYIPPWSSYDNEYNGGCNTSANLGCVNDESCDRGNPCVSHRCNKDAGTGTGTCEYQKNGATSCFGPFGLCSAAGSDWSTNPDVSACAGYGTPQCAIDDDCNHLDAGCRFGVCSDGACVVTAAACSDSDVCTQNERCDMSNGNCISDPVTCNDNNGCTDDGCDNGQGGCVYAPNTNPCDDASASTHTDTCSASQCVGTPCDAVPYCTVVTCGSSEDETCSACVGDASLGAGACSCNPGFFGDGQVCSVCPTVLDCAAVTCSNGTDPSTCTTCNSGFFGDGTATCTGCASATTQGDCESAGCAGYTWDETNLVCVASSP